MVSYAKNSVTNGLELVMDVESYDYSVSSTSSEGIVLSILHQVPSGERNLVTYYLAILLLYNHPSLKLTLKSEPYLRAEI